MKQLDQVKAWIHAFHGSMYGFNVSGTTYYAYTFYKRNAWDGEFGKSHELDELKNQYKHVIDLKTGREI